ncbi:647_t:CDS:1, partial [Scutellospora calospora]
DKYFLIQAKCYSKYIDSLYDKYKEFIKNLKEQPKEYIRIFLVGTYSKYSVLKTKEKSIAEILKEETKDIMNNSGHKIIICDDHELINIIKSGSNLEDENKEITFSRLRIFKLSEEKEHEFLLKLHGVIERKGEYRKLLAYLPSNTKFVRTRHQYEISEEIKKIGYAGFDFVDTKRRYVIRYEIRDELEYLERCVNDFVISLNIFSSNIKGIFIVPEKFYFDILRHI